MSQPKLNTSRQTVQLGRTSLICSRAGLGGGGASRLGLRYGKSEAEAADLVRCALDHGITFIDTARIYGTEAVIGAALKGRRDGIVLSTKLKPIGADGTIDPARIQQDIELSLKTLRLDHIDILHFHGVTPREYDNVMAQALPVVKAAQSAGKISHLAISERWNSDVDHKMLQPALQSDEFDVIMTGLNLINSSAARSTLPVAKSHNVGTLIMFAVRQALSRPDMFAALWHRLASSGELNTSLHQTPDDFIDLCRAHGVTSLMDAGYWFAAHSDGAHVILTGTGNPQHLLANIASIEAPKLPEPILNAIDAIFGNVHSVTGETA